MRCRPLSPMNAWENWRWSSVPFCLRSDSQSCILRILLLRLSAEHSHSVLSDANHEMSEKPPSSKRVRQAGRSMQAAPELQGRSVIARTGAFMVALVGLVGGLPSFLSVVASIAFAVWAIGGALPRLLVCSVAVLVACSLLATLALWHRRRTSEPRVVWGAWGVSVGCLGLLAGVLWGWMPRAVSESLLHPLDPVFQDRPLASSHDLEQSYIKGKRVRLCDVPRSDKDRRYISGKIFEDCIIDGPAVVSLQGGGFAQMHLDRRQPIDDLFITVEDGRAVYGIVALSQDCQFRNCVLNDIAYIGTAADVARAKHQMLSR